MGHYIFQKKDHTCGGIDFSKDSFCRQREGDIFAVWRREGAVGLEHGAEKVVLVCLGDNHSNW